MRSARLLRPVRLVVVVAAVVALAAAPAGAVEAPAVHDGPGGRTLLGGPWGFGPDRRGPWTEVTVPHAWNATDDSPASMAGGVAWYRKDFRVPAADPGLRWRVRFEGVDQRAVVYLNGRRIGEHTGAYLPWELPLTGVRRRGTNRLLVRVDSRRTAHDFPPQGLTSTGVPTGGWFTSSGIIREVTLRPVRAVALTGAQVVPELPCAACPARVRVTAQLAGAGRALQVRFGGRFGTQTIPGRVVRVPASGTRTVATSLRVAHPKVWSPASPALYPVTLTVTAGSRTLATWTAHTGIRSVQVRDGRLRLDFRPTALRGVGYHEEVAGRGMALTHADRVWLVRAAQELGATMLRTHYPPGEDLLELADRAGLLVWSEVPVYSVSSHELARPAVRGAALDLLGHNIADNASHPSVVTWSVGNELSPSAGPSVRTYIAQAAALVHRLDPTRPAAIAIQAYPSALCKREAYAPLDLIGLNDYFGWYTGPGGELFDRAALGPYLDAARACHPSEALMVTEFGAEANRDGPVEEKGTWAFQRDWVDFQLGTLATKPWLSGALYWALNEFRVRPEWEGGDPRPQPPLHQKGLLTYVTHAHKPAWDDVHGWFTAPGSTRRRPRRRAEALGRGGLPPERVRRGQTRSGVRRGVRCGSGVRRRGGHWWRSARRPGPRKRSRDWTASGSGTPPGPGRRGGSERRSLPPPPPPSSSSGGCQGSTVSDFMNIQKSTHAKPRATRWRPPNSSTSSWSGVTPRTIAPRASGRKPPWPGGAPAGLRYSGAPQWPVPTPRSSTSPAARSTAPARCGACAAQGASPGSSTAGRVSRSPSRSTRASSATRSPTPTPWSRSPSRATRCPSSSRSCSATRCAARSSTPTCCA